LAKFRKKHQLKSSGESSTATFALSKDGNFETPRIPWKKLKEKVLGKEYVLSLLLSNSSVSKKLNTAYRGKNKKTNVLSFPYSKTSGEIILDLNVAKKEHASYGHSMRKHCAFLFIHALLHLKGMSHGSKMETEEGRFLRLLGF
jgi:probable rRNA maturation factor